MQKGWNASEALPALLRNRRMTQQQLAAKTGIDRGTVNGYSTGRLDLGPLNARRIAAVLKVSLAELGAPEEEAVDRRSRAVLDRLRSLEAETAWLRSQLLRCLEALQLEPQEEAPAARSDGAHP